MFNNRTFLVLISLVNLFLLYSNMYLFESNAREKKRKVAISEGGIVRMLGQRIKNRIVRISSRQIGNTPSLTYFCVLILLKIVVFNKV